MSLQPHSPVVRLFLFLALCLNLHNNFFDKFSETDAFLSQDGEEDKPMSQQDILQKIRQKKEVMEKLRCQPWNMHRKRRTLL